MSLLANEKRENTYTPIHTHDLAVIVLVAVMPHTYVFSVVLWDPHLDCGCIQLLVPGRVSRGPSCSS